VTTLYSFSGPDGANPVGGLVQGADGNFYGVTSESEFTNQYGKVFRIAPDGTFTNLYSLNGASDGAWPQLGLVRGSDGNFYGTTAYRGANFKGTIFKITPSGDFSTLVALDSLSGSPGSLLVPATDGNLYSVGNFGFGTGLGSAFSVSTDGTVSVLGSFAGTNGFTGWSFSQDVLLQGADGNFFGATHFGGPEFAGEFVNTAYGTLFEMTPDGTLITLFSFNGTNGAYPTALTQGHDGNLYGTTGSGGPAFIDNPEWGGQGGYGTAFKLDTNGAFTTLAVFNGTNGSDPNSLIQASDGNFYGTTDTGGGPNVGGGTIFKLTAEGTLTSLLSFNGTNGLRPRYSTLAQAADGNFYGTTLVGGVSNHGTIFMLSLTPSPPVIQTVARAGSTLTLTWSADAGHTYRVQSLTDLTRTNWSSSGGAIAATNSIATASDSIGADRQRFYRVVLLP
jgi:uncharacterized repeat protein (TIGR03803 family)